MSGSSSASLPPTFVSRARPALVIASFAGIVRQGARHLYASAAAALTIFGRRPAVCLDALDRCLFRDRYNAVRLLRDLAAQIGTDHDFGAASRFAVAQVETTLDPEWLAVYARAAGDVELRRLAGAGAAHTWRRECSVMSLLRESRAPLEVHARSRAWTAIDPGDRDRLAAARVSLLVPVALGFEEAESVLMLGPKRSGEPYGQEDRDFLHAVGASLGVLARSIGRDAGTAGPRSAEPRDPVWEARLWELADDVASGRHVDWPRASAHATDDVRRKMLVELEALGRLMHEHGGREVIRGRKHDGAAAVRESTRRWGRFELRGLLGRGRFGTVHRAWDPTLEREVAVKLLEERVDRTAYLREARLLARAVRHPNVVHVYGADVEDDLPGFWMEMLEGQTLAAAVAEHGPLGLDQTLAVADAMCVALAAVHRAGLVHQDVKAENVMREREGRLVLMDIGAGVSDAARPRWGTPRYMAPELFRGGQASIESDMYSLGALLFFLSTGRFPVEGTYADIGRRHEEGTRHSLRDLRPELPEPFIEAVERSMSAEPADRYSTSDSLRLALLGGGVA